jgi:hypothetical protein
MPIPGIGAGPQKISRDAILITGGGILAAYFLWKASQPTATQPSTPSVITGGTPISPGGAVDNGAGVGAPASVIGQGFSQRLVSWPDPVLGGGVASGPPPGPKPGTVGPYRTL